MAGTNKRRSAPKDEARRIAANVAKLPGLLGREDYGLSATGAGAPAHPAYNPWVDRLNAIRLLQVLIAAGASSRAPMNGDWVHEIALRDLSLQVTKLASAIAYAEGEGWFADSPRRKDWICLTRAGEAIAKTAKRRVTLQSWRYSTS